MNESQHLSRLQLEKNRRVFPDRLASVILSAGRSSRMGRPKALLEVDRGSPAWRRLLKVHLECGFSVCLVTARELAPRLRAGGAPSSVLRINPSPDDGPLSSLLLGLGESLQASGLLVHAVDHPLVSSETLKRLAESHRKRPDVICIPSSHGKKGHPVIFPARFFRDLLRAPLECGARFVVRMHAAAICHVRVDDDGVCANLNTEAELRHWRRQGYWLRWPGIGRNGSLQG